MIKKLANKFGKLSLAMFLLSSIQVVAQTAEKDDDEGNNGGYVVLKTGDTLRGDIIDRDKKTNLRFEDSKVKLIISPTEKKSFSATKLKGYYKDNAWYETVEFKEGEYAFMEVVEAGVLTLYKLDLERIKKGELEVYETQYYVKKTKDKGPALRIKDGNFKKDMSVLCESNQDIVDEINSKDYVFEDIEKLVRDFNKAAAAKGSKPAKKEVKVIKGKKQEKEDDEDEEEEEK